MARLFAALAEEVQITWNHVDGSFNDASVSAQFIGRYAAGRPARLKVPLEMTMASELELKMLARLRAHEILIQHLLWLAFGKDASALRDYEARQNSRLDTGRLPDLDPAMADRLPYETQEALAKILLEIARRAEDQPEPPTPERLS